MGEEQSAGGKALSEHYLEERCYVSEWWNTRSDEPVSVARVRVEPGVTTRLHRLKGVTERYLILSGHGTVEVDGHRQDAGPSDVVVIPADAPQRVSNTGDRNLVFLAVCTPRFRPDVYEDLEGDAS